MNTTFDANPLKLCRIHTHTHTTFLLTFVMSTATKISGAATTKKTGGSEKPDE